MNIQFPNPLVPNVQNFMPWLRPIRITRKTDHGLQQTAECNINFGEVVLEDFAMCCDIARDGAHHSIRIPQPMLQ